MGLFINSGGSFNHNNATVDLISIANMDTGYGETTISATRTQVTYARTLTGVCQVRLDALVNNTGYVPPPDITIFAVDGSFILADGTPITSAGGVTVPVGGVNNPTTTDVAVIYDTSNCNGTNYWVDKEGGGTTGIPTPVMIYHELSHALHFVTGTIAATSDQEEVNAETDENDMRNQLGVDRRDVTSHNGGCGGPPSGCCIVASISTGSAWSNEVNHLRSMRDKILRRSEVGDDFFNVLHYDYYNFSPEICSVMGNNPAITELIKTFFVVPIIHSLELIIHYQQSKGKQLAGFLQSQFQQSAISGTYTREMLEQLHSGLLYLKGLPKDNLPVNEVLMQVADIPGLEDLFSHLNRGVVGNPLIRWALLDSVVTWVEASLLLIRHGENTAPVEDYLNASISTWLAQLPITPVWSSFSRIQTETELLNLDNYIFDKKGKSVFANRLAELYPKHKETIYQWSFN